MDRFGVQTIYHVCGHKLLGKDQEVLWQRHGGLSG
jgi:hypothetical protein